MGKKTGKRYTEEQIIRILDELKSGKTVEEICRTYGVAQSTLYRW
ncbi:transposase, partial [bacterium]|nr:transposase [bacterium]